MDDLETYRLDHLINVAEFEVAGNVFGVGQVGYLLGLLDQTRRLRAQVLTVFGGTTNLGSEQLTTEKNGDAGEVNDYGNFHGG